MIVYVCRDYYVRRVADGFLVNHRNCYVAKRRTLRLAKKLFRRGGKNLEGGSWDI